MKNIEEMTIAEAREMLPGCRKLLSMFGEDAPPSQEHLLLGENVFIRTVAFHYTGRLVAVTEADLVLEDAAWIADSGRFAQALVSGDLSEVEPYPPGPVLVSRGAVGDVSKWPHPLPRETI